MGLAVSGCPATVMFCQWLAVSTCTVAIKSCPKDSCGSEYKIVLDRLSLKVGFPFMKSCPEAVAGHSDSAPSIMAWHKKTVNFAMCPDFILVRV